MDGVALNPISKGNKSPYHHYRSPSQKTCMHWMLFQTSVQIRLTSCLWGKWLLDLSEKHLTMSPKGPLLMLRFWACCLQGRKFSFPSFAVWAFAASQRKAGPFWRNYCFLLLTLGSDGSQCPPALGSHSTPCQTQALFIMPEMLNSNASTSPPLSSGRWEPTFIDKQFLLQIFQMAFPPPGVHTRSHCK